METFNRKLIDEAVELYHRLLDSTHLDSTREELEIATRDRGLSFGSRPVCTVLRPCFLDESTYQSVKRASTLVAAGLAAIGRRVLTDAGLRRELELSPDEEEIIGIATGYGAPDVSARLDGFLSADGQFNFVEYNAESPGGLAYGNALSDAFAAMPIMRDFGRTFQWRALPVRSMVIDTLLEAFRRWGGSGLPNVAIVDWRGVSTYNEFLLMQEEFEARGCSVRIADPEELDYRDGRLTIGDFRVDLVYKRVVIGELLAKYGARHPLIDAVRDRSVCMANGFGVQALYKKAIFAIASDPAYGIDLAADVRRAFDRHIPWTRIVRDGKTTYGDKEVDLLEFIAAKRERLVLKPSGEYGGKGVTLGWEVEDESWRAAMNDATSANFIVQERIPLGREPYPTLMDGRLRFDERYFDLDPYVWDGERVEGLGVRLSSLALLNVSAGGGSATPLFVISKRD